MKRKTAQNLIMVLVGLALCYEVQAARPRLAVIGFTNTHRDERLAKGHERLRDNLEAALLQCGRFEIVERARLEALLAEKKMAREGLIADPFGAVSHLQGADLDFLVMGSLEGDHEATKAIVKFIRVSPPGTGTVSHVFEAVGVTVPYVGYLSYELSRRAREAFPVTGKVYRAGDADLVLDIGRNDGVNVGDEFVVQCVQGKADDPYQEKTDVARVRVVEAQERGCRAEMIERLREDIALAPGLPVISCSSVRGEETQVARRRLAVSVPRTLAPANPSVDGPWFASALATELTNRQATIEAQVLEREHIEALYDEFRLTELPIFDWKQAAKAGNLFSANTLITSTLTKSKDLYVALVRIDDLEHGRVLQGLRQNGKDLTELAAHVAQAVSELLRPPTTRRVGDIAVEAGVRFNYDVVPSGQYVYLSRTADLLTVRLRNKQDKPVRLRVATEIAGYCARPLVKEIRLEPGATKDFGFTPPLDMGRVAALSDNVKTTVQCRIDLLTVKQTRLVEDSCPITLLPPSTWLARLKLRQSAEPMEDFSTIVAWLEQSDALTAVRTRAAQLCEAGGLLGYQDNFLKPEEEPKDESTRKRLRDPVFMQVKAIYQALRERNIKYTDQTMISFPATAGQRVMRPDQVLKHSGANCLDSSVLFAAVLMPTFRPVIILTRTHAFVGWQTWSHRWAPWDVLETTQLGVADFETALERGRKVAEQQGILKLLEGKAPSGRLEFSDTGLSIIPAPNGIVIIDVRAAKQFYESYSSGSV